MRIGLSMVRSSGRASISRDPKKKAEDCVESSASNQSVGAVGKAVESARCNLAFFPPPVRRSAHRAPRQQATCGARWQCRR